MKLLGIVFTHMLAFLFGYEIGIERNVNKLCNKSQYDFCQMIQEPKQFKIKG